MLILQENVNSSDYIQPKYVSSTSVRQMTFRLMYQFA